MRSKCDNPQNGASSTEEIHVFGCKNGFIGSGLQLRADCSASHGIDTEMIRSQLAQYITEIHA